MEGPASPEKNIIQSAEKPIQDLHAAVSSQLDQAGHPATPQSVNPEDQSPLENVRRIVEEITSDPVHIVGSTLEEHTIGKSPTTHVRTLKGEVPVLIALKRRFLKKAA